MKTHAAAFCLGVWVMGTVCVSIVAMQNFYTIDRLLDGPSHAAFAKFVEDAGREGRTHATSCATSRRS